MVNETIVPGDSIQIVKTGPNNTSINYPSNGGPLTISDKIYKVKKVLSGGRYSGSGLSYKYTLILDTGNAVWEYCCKKVLTTNNSYPLY